jgi:hypothetical protein
MSSRVGPQETRERNFSQIAERDPARARIAPVTRSLSAVATLLGAVVIATGCGGGNTTHTLRDTRECLAGEQGVRVTATPASDFVARNALGGSLGARIGRNAVVISFGLDESGAARIASAYRRVRGRNIGIADVLRPSGNAVLLWKAHPEPEAEETVTGCLK